MKKPLICLTLAGLLVPAAFAQWEDDWPIWETETDMGATLLAATDADERALFRLWAAAAANRVLENGLEIGFAGRMEIQKDHPARAGFTGVPSSFAGSGLVLQGALTGLSIGAPVEDEGFRPNLELAYLYAEGGYGEVRLGRDEGVALRFREGAPSMFETAAVGAAKLDPYGTDIITVRHDVTGPSLKVSYTTPRLLGLRAGLSFTPNAGAEGLDRDAGRTVSGTAPLHLENAVEAALNFSRRLPDSGVRVRAGIAVSTAETDPAPYAAPAYERLNSWSIGGSAEFKTMTLGVSWLSSNNGIDGPGQYDAWTVGLTKQLGKFTLGAEYGAAEDELTGLESDIWSAGVSRDFGEFSKVTLGYRDNTLELTQNTPGFAPSQALSPSGIVIEITLSR